MALTASLPCPARPRGLEYGTELERRRFFYGIGLSAGSLGMKITPQGEHGLAGTRINADFKAGMALGINGVAGVRIGRGMSLSLSPGIVFSSGTMTWHSLEGEQSANTADLKSYYLTCPVSFKVAGARMTNVRPFAEASLGYSNCLNSNENSPDDNANGVFRMKTHGAYAGFAAGFDIYTPYIRVSPSVKAVWGLTDILVRDEDTSSLWTEPIKSIHLRGIFFSIKFR